MRVARLRDDLASPEVQQYDAADPPVEPLPTASGERYPTERLALANPAIVFVDEAYSGVYIYAPEVFMTGTQFKLEIRKDFKEVVPGT